MNSQDSCGKILEAKHLGGDVTTVTGLPRGWAVVQEGTWTRTLGQRFITAK